MTEYMVTIEDGEGMWWEEPVAASTRGEAVELSRKQCAELPSGYVRVVYECRPVDTVET